jgi:hypothetical protein
VTHIFDFLRSIFMESRSDWIFGRAEKRLTVTNMELGPLSSILFPFCEFLHFKGIFRQVSYSPSFKATNSMPPSTHPLECQTPEEVPAMEYHTNDEL